MSNTAIWDAVSKTDPKYTKKVNQRGGFTAVNANSQVLAATKQFGPIGIGWGYDTGHPIITDEGMILMPVTLWHGDRSNVFGPEYGCAELIDAKSRRDSDAPKKATTDALTKLLSRLGFNADVFLGLYDDNKYVAQVAKEFEPKPELINDDQRQQMELLCDQLSFPVGRVLDVKKITDLRQMPATSFDGAMKWIETEAKKMETK